MTFAEALELFVCVLLLVWFLLDRFQVHFRHPEDDE